MRMIPSPDTYRIGTEDISQWMCDQIAQAIADMRRHGISFAGVLFDSIFSSDGVIPGKPGFLKPVIDLVHNEGGVYIADEVQPGFCRTGEAFGDSSATLLFPTLSPWENQWLMALLVLAWRLNMKFSTPLPKTTHTLILSQEIPLLWLPRKQSWTISKPTTSFPYKRNGKQAQINA